MKAKILNITSLPNGSVSVTLEAPKKDGSSWYPVSVVDSCFVEGKTGEFCNCQIVNGRILVVKPWRD